MPTRRRYLRGAAASVAPLWLAGCTEETDSPGEMPTAEETPTTREPTARKSTTRESTAGDPTTSDPTGQRSTPTDAATGTATPIHADYETTVVTARTPAGDVLGSVTAAIADTPELRYRGLSDTASLPADRGMLFVYDAVGDHTFVMREMDFGIDIVYADDEGVVTRIHHAPAPGPEEDGNDQRYPGRGQYVLEVNYDWTTDRGVDVGDVLSFEL